MRDCDHCANWAQWKVENKETRKVQFVCGAHKETLLRLIDPDKLKVSFCGAVPTHANA